MLLGSMIMVTTVHHELAAACHWHSEAADVLSLCCHLVLRSSNAKRASGVSFVL